VCVIPLTIRRRRLRTSSSVPTRRRLWDVDVRTLQRDVVVSAPDIDVNGTSSLPRRRRQWDVVVIAQTSTLEREVDVCVRSNFVTNGLPYGSPRHSTTRSYLGSASNLYQDIAGNQPTTLLISYVTGSEKTTLMTQIWKMFLCARPKGL
jgi:hypothetical protein